MEWLKIFLQIVVALGIFNVWILRFNKESEWRGKDAKNMAEEFLAYGLPKFLIAIIGGIKVCCAVVLIFGIWVPVLIKPAALVIAFLMAGAVFMHFKAGDSFKKSLPALAMMLMSLGLAFL